MKIPLTISEDYCHTWGIYEGIREFMQNGRDETRRGCTFDAWYIPQKQQVRLVTKGTVLEHRTLLMGSSDKRGRSDMLGQHGEGYKVGCVVLLRLGKRVKIRTANEVWEPTIEYSKKFKDKVIVFDIKGGRKHRDEVQVEIYGVTQEEWDQIKWKFLFLDEHDFEVVETPAGDVLLNADGNMYGDGIWIHQNSQFEHGYNFLPNDVKMDRDRRLLDNWDTSNATARVWEALYLRIDGQYCDLVDEMLAKDLPDASHVQYDWVAGEKTREKVASRFIEKHGENAVPVSTVSEARELEFFGKKGEVVVAKGLRNIVERKVGTLHTVRAKLAEEVRKTHDIVDLDPEEAKNLIIAQDFAGMGTALSLPPVKIVDFADPKTVGMRSKGEILIARKTLGDLSETIKTVVEEVAHAAGADGTHSHVEMIHEIYAKAAIQLLTKEE